MSRSRLSRVLHASWHHLTQLALLMLILVAAYVAMGRQLSAVISAHKDEVARFLSWQLGWHVDIATMDGGWQGINARWRLRGVSLDDAAHHWHYVLPEVEVEPEVLASIIHADLRLSLTVRGVDLHVQQSADGSWSVAEFAALPQSDPQRLQALRHWLLRQPQLRLTGRIHLRPWQRPELQLARLQLQSYAAGERHALRLRADLRASGFQGGLDLRLHTRGEPGLAATHYHVYARLPAGDWGPWWPSLPAWSDWQVQGGRSAGLQIWGDHDRQQDDWLIQAQRLGLAMRERQQPFTLGVPSLQLHWQRQAQLQSLSWAGGRIFLAQHALSVGPLQVQWQGGALRLAVDHVALAPLVQAVSLLPLASDPHWQSLLQSAPQGELDALALRIDHGRLRAVRGRAHGLGWRAVGALPGLQGLALEFASAAQEGMARLHLEHALYTDPQRFAQALRVDHGAATVRWWQDSDLGLQVEVQDLLLENQDLALTGQMHVDTGQDQRLSLRLALPRGDAAHAWKYLPSPILGQATLNWLQAALQSGRVTEGRAAYEGSWSPTRKGHLQVALRIDQARLKFDPAWPALTALQTELRIRDDQIDLSQVDAHSRALHIVQGEAHIDAGAPEAMLHVDVPVNATVQESLRWLQKTPLQTSLASIARTFSGHGPVQAHLQLDLPLRRLQPHVHLQLQFMEDDLLLQPVHLPLQHVQGGLLYDSQAGLSGQLNARVLEQPTHAVLSTVMHAEQPVFHVAVTGAASVHALAHEWPGPWWEKLSGSFPWQAHIMIWPGSGHADTLQWQSNLQGLASQWPAPLGKNAHDSLPLRFDSSLNARRGFMSLALAQRLALAMVEEQGQLQRAALRLGSASVGWPMQAGLSVQGHCPELDLDAWSAIWHHFAATPGASAGMPLRRASVDVDRVIYQGYQFDHVRARVDRQAHAWHLQWASDRLTGDVHAPDVSDLTHPVSVHLTHLFLPLPQVAALPANGPPTDLPPLLIDVDALQLRGYPDSSVHALLHQAQGLWQIDDLHWSLSGLRLLGQMSWTPGTHSHFHGHVESDDISRVFSLLGRPPTIDAEQGRLDLDLDWPGAPWNFHVTGLQGQAQLLIQRGRILSVSKTASVSRVVGLFSFADLGRRLKLDFSDLTEKGLAFDQFDAHMHLAGPALQVDVFHLKGPAVSAQGQGRLNLVNHGIDLQMAVTVPVTRVLPLAAAVVAGPLVGGAVLAAQAVLSHPLAKLTSVRYHLGGSWDDPQVHLLGDGVQWPVLPDLDKMAP